MLPKEKMEHVIPGPAPKIMYSNKEQEKISGSLSDGSVCELPPLSKMAYRRHQLQNQTNYHRQDYKMPAFRNGFQSRNVQPRKRFSSTGDRDQTGSSGYDTASKKSKRDSSDSPVKAYDPVMENRVSSTNNDFVYKFTGSTPTEDYQVTYTLEERVRAAALALIYSNCRITTEKFEWLYDKPAPDFKTIFGWRQRLLTTGCLIDSHVDKNDTIKQQSLPQETTEAKAKPVLRIPNPDEIPIISDSEDEENSKDTQVQDKLTSRQRSVSAETLLLATNDQDTRRTASSVSTGGRRSQARSQSESSNERSRSSSRDSQDSNYPDTDSEKLGKSTNSKTSATNNKSSLPSRSTHDTDSDSISYNSEDDNFLSRVYGDKKVKRKFKKRSLPVATVAPKPANYIANVTPSFQGYSTAKPTVEQSPLVTGNIYTSNLRNMNARTRTNENVIDTDGCSSEYIPTKLGSTTKNYQEFKNNVRRKGYWAKGNGSTFGKKNMNIISNEPITRPVQNKSARTYIGTPQNANVQHFYNIANTQNVLNNNSPHNRNTAGISSGHNNVGVSNLHTVASIPNNNTANVQKNLANTNNQNILNTVNDTGLNVSNTASLQKVEYSPNNHTQAKPSSKPSKEIYVPQDKDFLIFNQPINSSPMEVHPSPKAYNFLSSRQTMTVNRSIDFSSENLVTDDHYLPFDRPAQSTPNMKIDNMPENTSCIFDVVQSNNTSKNKSILDIFMSDSQVESGEKNNDLEKYDGVHKKFETSWDEDDDALYKDDSIDENVDKQDPIPSSAIPQSPTSNMLYATDDDQSVKTTPIKITPEIIQVKQDMLMGILNDFQNINAKESTIKSSTDMQQQSMLAMSQLEEIPAALSTEIICMSEINTKTQCQENVHEIHEPIKPSKQIHILESITIRPGNKDSCTENEEIAISKQISEPEIIQEQNKVNDVSQEIQNKEIEISTQSSQPPPALDLANLLSGINTNTLFLALQNLQQINQGASNQNLSNVGLGDLKNKDNDEVQHVETINLTNDEEWEKESNRDGSIERELKKLDGDTGDTPFLSDIFDPGPVVMPSNIGRKLNINLKSVDENKAEAHKPHLNENAPVIGNFKSFALPKPIMLNRLKLTVKPPEKPKKASSGKKSKRKKKVCIFISCTQ